MNNPFTTRDNWMFGIAAASLIILIVSLFSVFYVLHSLFWRLI